MTIIILFIAVFGLAQSEAYKAFKANSNNNPNYAFVSVHNCETGKRESGFAFAPSSTIVLKQRNQDGTVGPVCQD